MYVLRNISDSGVSFASSSSEKRNVILSNYIALLVSTAIVCQAIARTIYVGFEVPYLIRATIGAMIFFLPVFLNRFAMLKTSRMIICWMPYVYLFAVSIALLRENSIG